MSRYALGVMVSADALHAVLLERAEEETVAQLRRSFARRAVEDADLPFSETDEAAPAVDDEPEDVTIQFGDDGGDDNLFLGSEFEDYDDGADDFSAPGSAAESWNFQAKLDDLLDQCAEAGFEDPEIAFCETTAEIDEVELRLPSDEADEESEGQRGFPLPAPRAELLEMLEEQYDGSVEADRVGFVPMHRTGDQQQRVLALISRPGGPVQTTLSAMQNQTLARSPRTSVLDAEASLYVGLARSILQLPPDTPEKTILVRTGLEDTLVLFIEGNTLRQSEYLPELTSEDSAETICSRVLLLQDEYGMGEVQHIMLIAEDNEGVLADAFKSYFASASLRLVRNHLPGGEASESAAYIPATGMALRLLDDPDYEPFFQDVDLLPKKFTASRFRLPVGWSVPALLGVLAITTLGFVWYYFMNAQAIGERRAKLQNLQRQLEQVDEEAMQRRIDSTQAAVAQYSEGLEVIDGLLQGSNKWSRELASVTAQMNEVGGLSIGRWSPQSDTTVRLSGRSRTRPRVVQLARGLEGEINTLTFTETRDVQLYEFNLTVPLDTMKPRAVSYWREQQLAEASSTSSQDNAERDTAAPAPDPTLADAGTPTETTDDGAAGGAASSSPEPAETAGSTKMWTVVVASLARNVDARTVASRYRRRLEGSGHEIQVRHSGGIDRYRVGVGTFSTFEAARSAMNEMGDSLPEGAWLHLYSASSDDTASTQNIARSEPERE